MPCGRIALSFDEDGRALQAAPRTTLGSILPVFNITYLDKNDQLQYVWRRLGV